jgi:hypothetical protein
MSCKGVCMYVCMDVCVCRSGLLELMAGKRGVSVYSVCIRILLCKGIYVRKYRECHVSVYILYVYVCMYVCIYIYIYTLESSLNATLV